MIAIQKSDMCLASLEHVLPFTRRHLNKKLQMQPVREDLVKQGSVDSGSSKVS